MNSSSDQSTQQEQEKQQLDNTLKKIKHKIIVLSGKGGVGKSTIAVNLAASLSAQGQKTGLLDVDIHGPSIPKLLGLEGSPLDEIEGKLIPIQHNETLRVISIGFLIQDANEPIVWRGPLKHNAIKQFIKDVSWGELDYLIVDSPPGTGDEPLAVCQMINDADGAVIVTTPQDVALLDVKKSITFCNKLSIPILGVVENMSGFKCPHCEETIDVFKSGGGETMATEMGVPFLGRLPLDPEITSGGDSGNPFSTSNATSLARKNFDEILKNILK